jgi:hypothetical protein
MLGNRHSRRLLLVLFTIISLTLLAYITSDRFLSNNIIFADPTHSLVDNNTDESRVNISKTIDLEQPELSPHPRILVGVITILEKVERRTFLREFYNKNLSAPNIDVVFVIARQDDKEKIAQLNAERSEFNDIMYLEETTENMNGGKSYYFFKHAYESLIDSPYNYIIKTDDDSLIHLPHLAHRFETLPRFSLYWGREWYLYMGGTGIH